jgi:hypothetical protein
MIVADGSYRLRCASPVDDAIDGAAPPRIMASACSEDIEETALRRPHQ